uniref:Gamma-glutamylcyclotransferase family protein n=2 Tax=Amblyomma TaxID=6942 RepID=G3MSE7_AMBMU
MVLARFVNPLSCVSGRALRFVAVMASHAKHYVFVYGTLKTGEPNGGVMKDSMNGNATLIGTATTVKKWPLVIASTYNIPYLLYCEGKGHNVTGELYAVDDKMLSALDDFECHPKYYVRTEEDVELAADQLGEKCKKQLRVWIYFLKNYREELLQRPYIADYSSKGQHGLEYVPRYLRLAQDPKNSHAKEVLNEAVSLEKVGWLGVRRIVLNVC